MQEKPSVGPTFGRTNFQQEKPSAGPTGRQDQLWQVQPSVGPTSARANVGRRNRSAGPQISGTLCTYYREMIMLVPISGIFCTYFPMNGPKRGYFLAVRENSNINCLYLSQMDGYRWNNHFLPLCFSRWSFSDSLAVAVFLGAIPSRWKAERVRMKMILSKSFEPEN